MSFTDRDNSGRKNMTEAKYLIYKDPKQQINRQIKDLMNWMPLEEKIDQMTQIDGSELLKKVRAAMAVEARATGIRFVFAPCITVCRDPRWGRCYEGYGEDHTIVQEMTEIIPGLQGYIRDGSPKDVPFIAGRKNVAPCAKHFVGDGGTIKGINERVTDFHGLLSIHMSPYFNSIKGVSTIMISLPSWNGVKMHANRELITGVLKNKLRFRMEWEALALTYCVNHWWLQGSVLSDWQGLDKITSPPHANSSYSFQVGILAGIDMKPRELAWEAVRRSLVLLKNGKSADEPLLPLPKKASRILVAGSHVDSLGNQCGGWTITLQELGTNSLTIGSTILAAMEDTLDPTTEVVWSKNPGVAFLKSNKFSNSIVAVVESPYVESFGDSSNLTIPEPDLLVTL
ncbi:Glycoside hydrolase, family 3, N-terminal [Dillenia turbinata]|uniref:beta-glucosidase n=1 Tax=Dillenia turbinata TaxID=194707 RepID=A0AAN8Z4W5_9MAGN